MSNDGDGKEVEMALLSRLVALFALSTYVAYVRQLEILVAGLLAFAMHRPQTISFSTMSTTAKR